MKTYKVLVLGVDDRSALTVIRSLGRKGVVVHQGVDVLHSVASGSRYVRRVITFPSVSRDPGRWVTRLAEVLRADRYDLVIPTADNYLVQMVQHREQLAPLALLAIPDDRGFEYTYRKSQTLALAESLGVPIPHSREVTGLDEVAAVCNAFEFPVIVKPVSSKVWQENVRHVLDVTLAKDRADLERQLARLLQVCPVLIQSFHQGIGVGQEFLMREGQMVAAFQHERVHEPLGGGGSSYRKSVPLDPGLLKHSLAMLAELRWTGVAMVEYKHDHHKNESVLMEINGRFWGSLPLAVAAGVDFPGLLFDMMVKDETPALKDYLVDIYARNPVKDLDWLKENIRADKSDPFKLTVPLPRVAAEIVNLLALRERWDTITLDDPLPGVRQLAAYAGETVRGASAKIRRLAIELNHRYNPMSRRFITARLRRQLARKPYIAFVCKGNICRSPFADIYLQQRLNGRSDSLRVDSFGLIERVNRPSPDNAIAAAREGYDIDMSPHRSKLLTGEEVKAAGALVIMDFELYQRVRSLFPHAKKKVFFLGTFQNPGAPSVEILDPYGGSLDRFHKIYRQIQQSVDNLLKIV